MSATENQGSGARWRKWFSFAPGSLGVLAIVSLVAYVAWQRNASVDIQISPTGTFSVMYEPGDTLGHLIERALEDPEKREDFVAMLESADVFDNEEVNSGFRRMLWNLEGPFALPGTLSKADEDFYRAVLELDRRLSPNGPGNGDEADVEANAFLAQIYRDQLDRKNIFADRPFPATLKGLDIVHRMAGDQDVIYVCPGSDLRGRQLTLTLRERPEGTRMRMLHAVAKVDPIRFQCAQPAGTFRRYLAHQPARLGMARDGLAKLYPEDHPLPDSASVQFIVLPRTYVPNPEPDPQIIAGGADR